MPGKKKPFSAKQKKEQLKQKREKKREEERDEFGHKVRNNDKKENNGNGRQRGGKKDNKNEPSTVSRLNEQPGRKTQKAYNPNRYRLHFMSESREEIEARKKIAQQPYDELREGDLELDLDAMYQPGSVLDMPKRPEWNHGMSKEELVLQEEEYFQGYLDNILDKHSPKDLSYMELNLETWRQLWRCLEMSDILLLIADIRHPA